VAELLEHLHDALRERYHVERELGRGGMGIVFLAHDLKHDRAVAIKVLRPEVSTPTYAGRFLREIRITAQLQHPNILPVIESGDLHGSAYYIMPYVEGESLRQRLDREHQLPIEDALHIAAEVGDALAYAHDRGFVHRDIKPENILLTGRHALLADFGIARALTTLAGEKLTETGIAVGTPEYMSPEQAGGTGEADARSDVYSLACVVYEMLAGTPPFTAANPMAVMARKAMDPVPGLRVVRDTVAPHVERAVMIALARVPADRFASARDFVHALSATQAPAPRSANLALRSRRRWMLAGALGALLLSSGVYVLAAGVPFSRFSASTNLRFTQLTSAPGVEWFPSISPDGEWIVYAGQQSGNRDIYLQSVNGQQPINLTANSPDADDQPSFSPDGRRIAFRSERGGGGIFIMGRTGEGVRRVTSRGYRPTWSADGKQIAFTTENVELNPGNSESYAALWIVNVDDGTMRQLPAAVDPILPSWSPHGNRIAYSRRLGVPAQGDIYTIDPATLDTVALTSDKSRDWSPAWSSDGRWLFFSSDRGGSMNLWRIPIDERSGKARGPAEQVTTPATYLAHPTMASGGTIAYTSAITTINIERARFDVASGTIVGSVSDVTTGTRQWSSPDPSPNGEWVAFYTLTQPEGDLYVAHPDGSGLRQLTSDSAIDRLPRWAPDGRTISYFSSRAGPLNVWTIEADGSNARRLTTARSSYSAWSPDGKRIAIGTGPGGEGSRIIIVDPTLPPDRNILDTLPPWRTGRFLINGWSRDGTRLIGQEGAVGEVGHGIIAYTFATRSYERLLSWGEWPVWLPDNRHILFVANRHEFWVLDSRTKQAHKAYENARDVIGPPRITHDGRWVFFSRRVTEADVWLVSR
jgi:serine/threonine-protein kinase